MATPITADVAEIISRQANLRRYIFTVPSVAALSTSVVYSLDVGEAAGRIDYIRISFPNAVNADFHFLAVDNSGAIDTYQEVLELPSVNLISRNNNLGVVYSNDEADPASPALGFTGIPELYLVVENLDAVTATGAIALEIGLL